jgi:hypothetical protein
MSQPPVPTHESPFHMLARSPAGASLDPFSLQFLFAMGELSGQVGGLAREVGHLRDTIASQGEEINSLKTWRWILTGGGMVLGVLFTLAWELMKP